MGLVLVGNASGPGWVRALEHAETTAVQNDCTEVDRDRIVEIIDDAPVYLVDELGRSPCSKRVARSLVSRDKGPTFADLADISLDDIISSGFFNVR